MTIKQLDIDTFKQMVAKGADNLSDRADTVDALNVFPVPDGDTGTNMNLTMTSGVKELNKDESGKIGDAAQAFAKGLLMGARGNSGVILSQLFRGFARSVAGKKTISTKEFAAALESGVNTAYKAVMKPVEGTILTVAKDSAKRSSQISGKSNDFTAVVEEVVHTARTSLKHTPELLSVLKEVGVVDSGGQGLLMIYEGFLAGLTGKPMPRKDSNDESMVEMINAVHHKKAQAHLKTEDIQYGYCTEFMVQLRDGVAFDEATFRKKLGMHGDSLLVVSDSEIVKVHVHTEEPGEVLTYGQRFGELVNMKIENMRRQHREILQNSKPQKNKSKQTKQPCGVVAVASGDGLVKLFKSAGAGVVIEGGQTMNPSTEDIVSAVKESGANHVFILPNNGNIVMAAQQAAEVIEQKVTVIPTKTIPQGIAALVAFNADGDVQTNGREMTASANQVKSGQVTFAVRDTVKDGVEIKKDDFIAIADGKIISSNSDQLETAWQLIDSIVTEDSDIVTLIYGSDANDGEAEELERFIEEHFPDVEVEVHNGGQPVYSYIISVE